MVIAKIKNIARNGLFAALIFSDYEDNNTRTTRFGVSGI